MVEIKSLRKKAYKIHEGRHLRQHMDPKRFDRHPFRNTILALRSCLTQRSKEAHDRDTEQAMLARIAKAQCGIKSLSTSAASSIPSKVSLPRLPTTIPATPQKRNVSDSSFGTHSTETTPTKWVKPEASIQHVQINLVEDVLFSLYRGNVPISWARGRRRLPFIQYNAYISSSSVLPSTYSRSSKTYFKCFTRNNVSKLPDSIMVIPDGVLRIVKWKSAEEATIEWNKQAVCLAFEVSSSPLELRH